MNLRKMIFWKTPTASDNTAELPAEAAGLVEVADLAASRAPQPQQDAVSNVIKLSPRNPVDLPAGLEDSQSVSPAPLSAPQPRGLMDALELKAFFANNHFGLGYHNGANYKTQDALEMGKLALVSKFQNALAELVEQMQARADRLRNTQLQTVGLCDTTTAQLQLACTRLERDMSVLRDQMDKAAERKGWILEALNRYQIGFDKGLRVAIDFELLAD